jgi:hypothetical protein
MYLQSLVPVSQVGAGDDFEKNPTYFDEEF